VSFKRGVMFSAFSRQQASIQASMIASGDHLVRFGWADVWWNRGSVNVESGGGINSLWREAVFFFVSKEENPTIVFGKKIMSDVLIDYLIMFPSKAPDVGEELHDFRQLGLQLICAAAGLGHPPPGVICTPLKIRLCGNKWQNAENVENAQ